MSESGVLAMLGIEPLSSTMLQEGALDVSIDQGCLLNRSFS